MPFTERGGVKTGLHLQSSILFRNFFNDRSPCKQVVFVLQLTTTHACTLRERS